MKLGIIREGKIPSDSRVPLIPDQCSHIVDEYPIEVVVEPAPGRCFSDAEYAAAEICLSEDLSDCDLLLGVKEVPVSQLIPNKTYCFFSHTIKKQSYNRDLLRAILAKNIRLIDYEVMTDEHGKRLIAFGRFAGMVGAHNALYTYGERTGAFRLKRMKDCHDYAEAQEVYHQLQLPPVKIVLTGTGRVGQGAAQVLHDMGIRQVAHDDFLTESYDEPVFTQLRVQHYVARKDGKPYETREYYLDPTPFHSIFAPYYRAADIMINGIYWDKRAPAFFTREEMCREDFRLQVIADVTCDIAPDSSIPSTLRPSTIADPVYGYDPHANTETAPHQPGSIDVMAIDNLPNELPRDASRAFGEQFMDYVLAEFLDEQSDILDRATITRCGKLTERFRYLQDFVEGRE